MSEPMKKDITVAEEVDEAGSSASTDDEKTGEDNSSSAGSDDESEDGQEEGTESEEEEQEDEDDESEQGEEPEGKEDAGNDEGESGEGEDDGSSQSSSEEESLKPAGILKNPKTHEQEGDTEESSEDEIQEDAESNASESDEESEEPEPAEKTKKNKKKSDKEKKEKKVRKEKKSKDSEKKKKAKQANKETADTGAKKRKADKQGEHGGKASKLSESEKDIGKTDGGTKNSCSNRREWQTFGRWLKNKKRCPAKIIAACKDQDPSNQHFRSIIGVLLAKVSNQIVKLEQFKFEAWFLSSVDSKWAKFQSPSRPSLLQDTRLKLFNDYVECGEDFAKVEGIFQSRLEESQKTTAKYGFRNDVWLVKHHGQKKADKIMARKKSLRLILGPT